MTSCPWDLSRSRNTFYFSDQQSIGGYFLLVCLLLSESNLFGKIRFFLFYILFNTIMTPEIFQATPYGDSLALDLVPLILVAYSVSTAFLCIFQHD